MPSSEVNATPPPLSRQSSSSGSSFDVSGCLPTPSPNSSGPQRLRGAQWIDRGFRKSHHTLTGLARVAGTKEPLPLAEPAPLFQQQTTSPALAHTDTVQESELEPFIPPTLTQHGRLARQLFPEDDPIDATAPASNLARGPIYNNQSDRVVVKQEPPDEEEVDELASTQDEAPDGSQARPSVLSSMPVPPIQTESHQPSVPVLHRSVPLKQPGIVKATYGKPSLPVHPRSAKFHAFREAVAPEPLQSIQSIEGSHHNLEQGTSSATPAAIIERSMRKRAVTEEIVSASHDLEEQSLESSESFRPRKRPRRMPSDMNTESHAPRQSRRSARSRSEGDSVLLPPLSDMQDIPVEDRPDELYIRSIASGAHTEDSNRSNGSSRPPRRAKSPILTRRLARRAKEEKAELKRHLDRLGHSHVYEAVIEHPAGAVPSRAALEMGYMIPTPREPHKEGKKGGPPVAAQIVRKFIPSKVEETSFGSHLIRPKKKARVIPESSQETGGEGSPTPSLPEHDYVGPSPPGSPPRKPLSELKAGKYAVEKAEERERVAAAAASPKQPKKQSSSRRSAKAILPDPRSLLNKGHSALRLGPVSSSSSPVKPAKAPGPAIPAGKQSLTIAEQSRLKRKLLRRKPLEAKVIPRQQPSVEAFAHEMAQENSPPPVDLGAAALAPTSSRPERETRNIGNLRASVALLHTSRVASQSQQSTAKALKGAHSIIDPLAFRLPQTSTTSTDQTIQGRAAILAGASRPFTEATENSAAMDIDILASPSRDYTIAWSSAKTNTLPAVQAAPEVRMSLPQTGNRQIEVELVSQSVRVDDGVPLRLARGLQKHASVFQLPAPPPLRTSGQAMPRTPSKAEPVDNGTSLAAGMSLALDEEVDELESSNEASTPPPAAQPAPARSPRDDFRTTPTGAADNDSEPTCEIIVPGTPSPPHPESPESKQPSPESLVTLQSKSKTSYGVFHDTVSRLADVGGNWKAHFPGAAQKRRYIEQDTQAAEEATLDANDPFLA